MKTRFLRLAGVKSRAKRASTVGLFLTLFASAASAGAQGPAAQRRAATTPDLHTLRIGDIPETPAPPASRYR